MMKNLFNVQIVKLLGPFPKEFIEGECAEEFSEFIGTLSKRLNKCTDAHFLMLIERMLTYVSGKSGTYFLVILIFNQYTAQVYWTRKSFRLIKISMQKNLCK